MGSKGRDIGDPVEFLRSHGFEPLAPYPGKRSIPWPARCTTCGRETKPYIKFLLRGNGCRHCAASERGMRQRIQPEDATGVMRDAGVDPLEIYPGNRRPWRSRCRTCGKEVSPTYSNVRKGQGACGYCAKRRVEPADAITVMREAGLEPLEPFPGVTTGWRARCEVCHRIVSPQYQSVARGSGCGYCKRNRVDEAEALTRIRATGMEPLEPFQGAHTPWLLQCLTCGAQARRTLLRAERNQSGCSKCNLLRRSEGHRVPESDARAVMEAAGLLPLDPYTAAIARWRCKCLQCGREVVPSYHNVRKGQLGCLYCANRGIAPDAEALVYLVVHEPYDAVKVGIAAAGSKRVLTHESERWETSRIWDGVTGDEARQIEREVLRWWRIDLQLPHGVPKDMMPQYGYTETAPLHMLDLDATIARIDGLVAELP